MEEVIGSNPIFSTLPFEASAKKGLPTEAFLIFEALAKKMAKVGEN